MPICPAHFVVRVWSAGGSLATAPKKSNSQTNHGNLSYSHILFKSFSFCKLFLYLQTEVSPRVFLSLTNQGRSPCLQRMQAPGKLHLLGIQLEALVLFGDPNVCSIRFPTLPRNKLFVSSKCLICRSNAKTLALNKGKGGDSRFWAEHRRGVVLWMVATLKLMDSLVHVCLLFSHFTKQHPVVK